MATELDRQRRHDEQWQHEVLTALGRLMDVLHDISDAVRGIATQDTRPPAERPIQDDRPVLLTVEGLADHLGVSVSTVRSLRASGGGPPATKIGRRTSSIATTWGLGSINVASPRLSRPSRGEKPSSQVESAQDFPSRRRCPRPAGAPDRTPNLWLPRDTRAERSAVPAATTSS